MRRGTHKTHGLAVDSKEADDGLRLAGPMDGVRGGEVIGVGPYGEIGVVSDQGSSGIPDGLRRGDWGGLGRCLDSERAGT
ncbi:hypothetical protein ACPOL_2612 [Acidisarcina polymorpha]|uniref:Uncharacterized protein n=1 Tax=Acidisarcina polymorpha TaxID=2211140 RepID=A0A2Z5FYK0_9BACT|nr:hypothetical protein ACPOL_2612 [Acidisarcina polymorpha]